MTDVTTTTDTDTLYCVNHPQTATLLRCNKCGNPICVKCAVRTPVGYRCRSCNRAQQQVFETAEWYDYAIAIAIAAPLAALAGFLVTRIGFFVIILAPVVGGAIAEAVRFGVRRRRGRYLAWAAVGGFVLGGAVLIAGPLLGVLLSLLLGEGGLVLGSLFGALWPLVYVVLGASTLYARLRGISI